MHPYHGKTDQSFWKRFVSNTAWRDLNLAPDSKFQLTDNDRIATAGSCFAQHIARYLRKSGRSVYLAERPHPLSVEFGGETDSYNAFSARYGNVYTSRQCLELFQQAVGERPVIEDFVEQEGRVYDLLRPNAIPNGFTALRDARADRAHHLRCVRTLFETTDVFVFTLGLTESWYHTLQGHTYPVCPGTARGKFDPEVHRFRNLTHADVLADMVLLLDGLLRLNPKLRVILTVSPVPLVATYTAQNVLVASSYSKSVLRAVAGELEMQYPQLQYFPSFEIISHAASFGQYLASDLRDVSERGVSHVMSSFFATFFAHARDSTTQDNTSSGDASPEITALTGASVAQLECEEMFNDLIRKG